VRALDTQVLPYDSNADVFRIESFDCAIQKQATVSFVDEK